MRSVVLLLFLLIYHSLVAQSDLENRFNAAYQLSVQGNQEEALKEFKKLISEAPNLANAHIQASWCALLLGRQAEADRYAANAMYIDPFYSASHAIKYYTEFAKGSTAADSYLQMTLWLSMSENDIESLSKDFDDLIKYGFTGFANEKVKAKSLFASRDRSYLTAAQSMNRVVEFLQGNNLQGAIVEGQKAFLNCRFPSSLSYMKGAIAFQLGNVFNNYQLWNESQLYYEQALAEWSQKSPGELPMFLTAYRLASNYKDKYNVEKAFSILSSQYEVALKLPDIAVLEKAAYFNLLCQCHVQLNDRDLLKKHAAVLSSINVPGGDYYYYQANANNFMAVALEASPSSTDVKASGSYFEKAISIANQYGYKDLQASIEANYSFYLFKSGNRVGATQLLEKLANNDLAAGRYLQAENSYNNLGVMYKHVNDHRNAVIYFKKSIEIVEKYRTEFQGEDRLNFMARGVSSYNFMAASLVALKDYNALFEAQNNERGRVLSELLGQKSLRANTTLAEFQHSLQPDEAAIVYSAMEPGSVLIHFITNTSAYAIHQNEFQLFVSLKKKHLDRIQKAAKKPGYKPVNIDVNNSSEYQLSLELSTDDYDDMMQVTRDLLQTTIAERLPFAKDFLSAYYRFLIQPVESRLQGVKKLIIFPDGIFNFLPFESLTDSNGKYLVEKVDVRYVQSADVKRLIEARTYKTRAKSLLAMGGAYYDQMKESSDPVRGADRLIALQNAATINSLQNKPQREIYAALGFGKLNYLPGTLNEVKSIEKYFSGQADVYTGQQMTENFIKQLSKSGELKNYKVVHLATHGFALPEIPQLSGVAMCIFPNMQSGEDGYLTAAEISQLNMNADLAVLSACETGLGKIYGGEGVSGLTQSLLVGGANRAIVSLWPVSDQGTMYFMNGLYELTEKQGLSYDEAVNAMKRKFISGEFGPSFQLPGIWAPFVHYGK